MTYIGIARLHSAFVSRLQVPEYVSPCEQVLALLGNHLQLSRVPGSTLPFPLARGVLSSSRESADIIVLSVEVHGLSEELEGVFSLSTAPYRRKRSSWSGLVRPYCLATGLRVSLRVERSQTTTHWSSSQLSKESEVRL